MAEGFIVRRGGAEKEMKVITSNFTGNGEISTVTIPELIGCRCFYMLSQGTPAFSYGTAMYSISYFDGESSCVTIPTGSSNYTQKFNTVAFDAETGTITISDNLARFVIGHTYLFWGYLEEE